MWKHAWKCLSVESSLLACLLLNSSADSFEFNSVMFLWSILKKTVHILKSLYHLGVIPSLNMNVNEGTTLLLAINVFLTNLLCINCSHAVRCEIYGYWYSSALVSREVICENHKARENLTANWYTITLCFLFFRATASSLRNVSPDWRMS